VGVLPGGVLERRQQQEELDGQVKVCTVELVVWDTGIAIDADQHEPVFHAFTQADGGLARSHDGIGMGLAYANEMVQLMGGTLVLASELGAGSRFTVTLPA